jgi:hypothetical protein
MFRHRAVEVSLSSPGLSCGKFLSTYERAGSYMIGLSALSWERVRSRFRDAMFNDYSDITERIAEPPKWWDEHGVPRYADYDPWRVANIYAEETALVEAACQARLPSRTPG